MRYVILFLIVLQIGCSPTRHYKFIATHTGTTHEQKLIIAPKVAVLFPTEKKYLPGTVTIQRDTIVDGTAMIELNKIIDSLLGVGADSAVLSILKPLKPRIVRVIERYRDTVEVPATGLVFALNTEIDKQASEINKLKEESKQLQEEKELLKKEQNKWLWWFIGASIAFVLSIILHFKR